MGEESETIVFEDCDSLQFDTESNVGNRVGSSWEWAVFELSPSDLLDNRGLTDRSMDTRLLLLMVRTFLPWFTLLPRVRLLLRSISMTSIEGGKYAFGIIVDKIVLSTPLAVLSYFLIWFVPPFEDGKVIWYLFFYCLFQTLQTCFHVPYSALTMFISSEQKERDSATAYRMTVEVLGTLLGTAIQGQIVGMANAPCLPGPGDILADISNSSKSSRLNESEPVISLEDTKVAYMIASGVICSIYILCAIVLFCGVREQKGKALISYAPFTHALLLEGNFALFCSSTLGFRNDFQNILLVIMLSATLAIPFWQWFLMRFGKKTAVYAGTLSVVPFMILVVSLKSNMIVTYIVSFAAGVGVAAAFLLPWSMLPDVVDDFQVQNPDFTGHEALFYSFYVFFTKFSSGVSLGISTLSLDFAGYISRGCSQPEEVHLTLKLLVSAAPVVLIIIGLLILYSYPIDEERRQGNRKLLQEQRDNEADSETDSTELGNTV
ncbi:Sodium-dependent lysophosphatidylcholine symporter 1-B [Channa argus]|nr:Sodium-dependent lysophosphatidylcholine symporter 1-B [Channa argus]